MIRVFLFKYTSYNKLISIHIFATIDINIIIVGDRYVTFLLKNDRTRSILQNLVLLDHLSLIRQKESNSSSSTSSSDYLFGDAADTFTNTAVEAVVEGDNNGQTSAADGSNSNPVIAKRKKKNASIEIDAFQLISIDPGKESLVSIVLVM